MKKLILIVLVVLCLGLFSTNGFAGIADKLPIDKYSSKYDTHFIKYNKRFFGVGLIDYRWFKSQALSESALNPNAVSPVKASGILQIMPGTWKEIARSVDVGNNPFNARYNICAGVYYDKKMWDIWKSERSVLDRLALSFGSYNAGAGNLIKGQKKCIAANSMNCNTWAGVKTHAHEVNTWKSAETKGYIKRIFGYMGYEGW